MSTLNRREFLRTMATVGGGAVFAPSLVGLASLNAAPPPLASTAAGVARRAALGTGAYGELARSVHCPELSIPSGFTCVKLSETRAPSQADPGFVVPQAFDGMAAFPLPNGNVRLIRNHEMRDTAAASVPLGGNAYDLRSGGGTTSLEVEMVGSGGEREVALRAEFVSLSGTLVNCAGGPTPWGSWLTCEETTEGFVQGRLREHGYVFEVPVAAEAPVIPVPLKAMGRFVHEAVAVDPTSGIVYETEDVSYNPENLEVQPGAGFYRFLPSRPGDLRAGGRLQMLAVKGQARYNTTAGQVPGRVLPVSWVDIDDPDPVDAAMRPSAVFHQGLDRGGAIFQRLEGCWYGDGSIFFNATSGGDAGAGQVWQYRPLGSGADAEGQLILVFESPGAEVLQSPDNLCVSPRGGLVICEDRGGIHFIRGLTPSGAIFDLVRTNEDLTEFCGSCFSPDGEVLFFNIQGSTQASGVARGGTYALWGPWRAGAL